MDDFVGLRFANPTYQTIANVFAPTWFSFMEGRSGFSRDADLNNLLRDSEQVGPGAKRNPTYQAIANEFASTRFSFMEGRSGFSRDADLNNLLRDSV